MALFRLSSLCLLSVHKALETSSAALPCSPIPTSPAPTTNTTATGFNTSCIGGRRRRALVSKSGRGGRRTVECRAAVVVEDVDKEVLVPAEAEAEAEEYDWREEWYPLYLTAQVPDDAPLGLTVFDKQVVLYRDGAGVLRCYEDRCPHRYGLDISEVIGRTAGGGEIGMPLPWVAVRRRRQMRQDPPGLLTESAPHIVSFSVAA
ncbi:hypothetical protein BHM03_00041779 [Ensete ventricosum]|nr:hypothetical protein BHM03_00041779 [Ensete ventricosum]